MNKGITLIELVIITLLVGAILAIAIPNMGEIKEREEREEESIIIRCDHEYRCVRCGFKR